MVDFQTLRDGPLRLSLEYALHRQAPHLFQRGVVQAPGIAVGHDMVDHTTYNEAAQALVRLNYATMNIRDRP